MKIGPFSSIGGVQATSDRQTAGPSENRGAEGAKGVVRASENPPHLDTVEVATSAETRTVYDMSELKKKAAERLTQNPPKADEKAGADDREERVQLAKLRASAGFYSRPEVIEEIARKISDNMER